MLVTLFFGRFFVKMILSPTCLFGWNFEKEKPRNNSQRHGYFFKKMSDHQIFKLGDEIIDAGFAYRIFEIKKSKDLSGNKERFIFYEPCFESKKINRVICSIPIKSIEKTHIRKPISKKGLKNILESLSEAPDGESQINTTVFREVLRFNDAQKTAEILKLLWIDKKDELTNFSRQKQDVFQQAMKRLTEEMALVAEISLVEAREKIERILEQAVD